MSEFITISYQHSPKSKHPLHKACSLEDPSLELQESASKIGNKKHLNLTPHSEQKIQFSDQRLKYQKALKLFTKDNNFRKQLLESCKAQTKNETQKSYALTLRSLQRKNHGETNITVLLKTEYPIIHNLVHKYFNYKFYNKEDHYNDIFLIWVDTYVSEEFVKRLKSYQRINHFPSSCELGRKDLLTINLQQIKKIMNQQYNFYPKTWILPREYDSFCSERTKDKFFIVKPHANCQGRGIYLTKNPNLSSKEEVLVQEYIDNPMLMDGCKFDLRIYVLLKSLNPLRIFVYKEGLCRLATSKYVAPNEQNFRNQKMHLTNYAINKLDPNFISNKDLHNDHKGHKRSYTSIIKYLNENGYDVQKIEQRIDSIIVRTILAGYTKMLKSYKKTRENNTEYSPVKDRPKISEENFSKHVNEYNNEEPSVCFELLGFDIMLLDNAEPVLLEINHQPSLIADSPFDMAVKKSLIMDTINLLNIDEKDKEQWEKCQKQGIPYRNKSLEEKQLQEIGGYRRIFPLSHIKYHNKSQSEIERVESLKVFYETIMNKILFREYKLINKIKINNYKTIGSRVESRRIQKNLENPDNNEKIPQTEDKKRNPKNAITENQKAIALTFYNLFNDAKYHIKKSSPIREENEDLCPEEHKIRNHIYLAEVDQDLSYPNFSFGLDRNCLRSPYEYISPSRNRQKRKNDLKELQQRQPNNISLQKDSTEKNDIKISAFVSYNKFRDNITSIRNKGFVSYISSQCQKRRPTMDDQGEQSTSPGKKRKVHVYSERKKEESPSISRKITKEDWQKIIVQSTQAKVNRHLHSSKERISDVKKILSSSTNEKIERANNIKSIRSQYQKLNFASFLTKHKEKSKSKLTDEMGIESKQTSPSAQ